MAIFDFIPVLSFLIILFLLVGKTMALRKNGIEVSSGTAKRKKLSFVGIPVFTLIFLLWVFETIRPVFQITFSLIPETLTEYLIHSFVVKISGSIIILFALILLAITLLHFKTSLRFGLNKNNHGKLITTGIFSISRNPFFLSLDIYFLGIALIFPNLFFTCFAIIAIISIHYFILKEEKFMLKVYGSEYEVYSKNVTRYIKLKPN